MTDDKDITTRILLGHMQAGFNRIDRQFKHMDERFQQIDKRFDRLERRVEEGFEEARVDRQGIHEDLDATIRLQAKHDQQIAILTGGPMPEGY